jgi:hypothetical protein
VLAVRQKCESIILPFNIYIQLSLCYSNSICFSPCAVYVDIFSHQYKVILLQQLHGASLFNMDIL